MCPNNPVRAVREARSCARQNCLPPLLQTRKLSATCKEHVSSDFLVLRNSLRPYPPPGTRLWYLLPLYDRNTLGTALNMTEQIKFKIPNSWNFEQKKNKYRNARFLNVQTISQRLFRAFFHVALCYVLLFWFLFFSLQITCADLPLCSRKWRQRHIFQKFL